MPFLTKRGVIATRMLQRVDWLPIWLIAPAGLLMSGLLVYPIVQGVLLGFFDTRILNFTRGGFVGMANYERLFVDPYFWNAAHVTFLYGAGSTLCTYFAGLAFALLLNRKFPGRDVIRTLFILPWAIPEIVAALIFVWMLDAQFGIINYALISAGVIEQPLAWLASRKLALPALILVTTWQQFPLAMLILLAGLQTIPKEEYEAATIDGANAWSRFVHVTLPGLKVVNVVLFLLLILNSFRRVTVLYAMAGGGPARTTETLSILTYNTAFAYQRIGYAGAVGTTLLVILMILSLIYYAVLLRRRVV